MRAKYPNFPKPLTWLDGVATTPDGECYRDGSIVQIEGTTYQVRVPYKAAQHEAAKPRGEYVVYGGVPKPDGPYALLVRQVGGVETGHRKIVRKVSNGR